MNLPNKLTLMRVILVPFFVAAALISFPHHYLVALVIFVVASVTDFFDGYLARKNNLVTNFGKFLDPLADKVLVMAALVCLLFKSEWPFYIPDTAEYDSIRNFVCPNGTNLWQIIVVISVIVIIAREFMVSGLRLVTAGEGVVVAADIWGKLKTAFTMCSIIVVYLFFEIITPLDTLSDKVNSSLIISVGTYISLALIIISTILTVISGVRYLWQMRSYINPNK